THGPAVADYVVHCHEQHMVFRAETHEARTYERSHSEIERQARLFRRALLPFVLTLVFRKRRKIDQGQLEDERRSNRLYWLGVDGWQTRTQTLVPPDDFIQRSLQRLNLQTTAQSHGDGNVVERAGWLQLMQEPKTLLRKREREFSLARYSNDWRSLFPRPI